MRQALSTGRRPGIPVAQPIRRRPSGQPQRLADADPGSARQDLSVIVETANGVVACIHAWWHTDRTPEADPLAEDQARARDEPPADSGYRRSGRARSRRVVRGRPIQL